MWKIRQESYLGAHVRPRSWNAACGVASPCGYGSKGWHRGYHTAGEQTIGRWGDARARGGIPFLVHKSVQHMSGHSVVNQGTQLAGLWLQEFLLVNLYSPPDHPEVMTEALAHFWVKGGLDRNRWVAVGDANEEPEASHIKVFLATRGGSMVDGQNTAPRRRIIEELSSGWVPDGEF